MKYYQLKLSDKGISINAEGGKSIMDAMIAAGIHMDAPCGGNGSCGKCRVEIRRNADESWQSVLACRTVVESDMEVRSGSAGDNISVLLDGNESTESAWKPWISADSEGERYMAAFDLGTTSVAAYLIDACTGAVLAKKGMINPQARFGADVISRIDYAMDHGTQPLSSCVREAINGLIGELCAAASKKNQVTPEMIHAVSIVGNTAMHHLFLDIAPDCLGKAPYMPAVREGKIFNASECGIAVRPDAQLLVLPVIAGYVGADTVGCLISGDWHEREKLTLLVDIGTNGELVLGNASRRIACSTAAGPALEGAKIECGMRAMDGAVDKVWVEGGEICYRVIGGGKAKGICGSGLVDLVAALLKIGDIDETGRFDEGSSYRLGESEVVLTQKDVREVQLAKGAICAGIRLMAQRLGVELEDIEEVHIAGAFGNYLDARSACDIGLIPEELYDKVIKVGNAAGDGACRVLRNREYWDIAQKLASETEFLELASLKEFQDVFVDELMFPEEDYV